MPGNDRSGTVDVNLNLLKAVELALTGGYDLVPFTDPMTGKAEAPRRHGPRSGDPCVFHDVREVLGSVRRADPIHRAGGSWSCTRQANPSGRGSSRPPIFPASCAGCAEKGLDVTQGGAEINFVTIEAVTFATTVDSLLAVKYLVFDRAACTMAELVQALKDNWVGHEKLQALARNRAPKYGRDDDEADAMGRRVMELWTSETWKHRTKSTGRQFRPGMLSWNYWVSDGFILAASPDGRPTGPVPLQRPLPVQRGRHQRPHGKRELRGQGHCRQ